MTFILNCTLIKRAELKIKTRQWLMERLNSEEFGLRKYLDVTQSYYDVSDDEIISGMRAAAKRAGVTASDIIEWMDFDEDGTVH